RLLETYNSLTDKHLVGYFSNARIRRHLQKSGLISRSGRIIPEKEYRLNAMRRDHQRHVLDCLADAIFHKVLDMERHHQLEIKSKFEYSVRKQRMDKTDVMRQTSLVLDSVPQRHKLLFFQVEQFKGMLEEVIPVHSPHPPLTPRNCKRLSPVVAGERACCPRWRAPGLGFDYGSGHCPHHHRTKEPAPSK
ncbi:ERIC3 protein, partial [Chaetops frenatus]|nr:ERIC3 protein [Chaetops frenatus]